MELRLPWDVLEQHFQASVAKHLNRWVSPDSAHFELTREFAEGRLGEGRQLTSFFRPRFDQPRIRILDLGAGNGGASIALANDPLYDVTALDVVINAELREVRLATRIPVRQIVGSGEKLPLAKDSFDIVLCLETIEHVSHPHELGREIMRVLRPGGLCMITTPARLRHLLAPDPHYGVRALLLLPDRLQRYVVVDLLHRSTDYDVEHIFWSRYGVLKYFPDRERVETLINIPYPGIARTPSQILWRIFRAWLWDRIIIHKKKF